MGISLIVGIIFLLIWLGISIHQRVRARTLKKKAAEHSQKGDWGQAATHMIGAIMERLDSEGALKRLVPQLQEIYAEQGIEIDPERVYRCPAILKQISKSKQKMKVQNQLILELYEEIKIYLTGPMSRMNLQPESQALYERTFEAWSSGKMSALSSKYAGEHVESGQESFTKRMNSELGKMISVILRSHSFESDEFIITGSEPSFLMTNRTLYLFTDEDLDGPLAIVALAGVEDYKTKGWLKDISITITMKDGSLKELGPMEGAPKENYVRAFLTE